LTRLASRYLPRLLSGYVLIAIAAFLVLTLGLWVWNRWVPPTSVAGAFIAGQVILFLCLTTRFWQRGCAVALCVSQKPGRDAVRII
jgi:hypothetical protein